MKSVLAVREQERQQSRSREGAWIEIRAEVLSAGYILVAPARERGLKSAELYKFFKDDVAPARERGFKSQQILLQ